MDERRQSIKLLSSAKANMLRLEKETVRDVAAAYEQARQTILAELTALFERAGDDPDTATIRHLANDLGLYRAIVRRLTKLEVEFEDILRPKLNAAASLMSESVLQEIGILASGIGVDFFPFVANELLELTIVPAIEQISGVVGLLRTTLLQELRTGLAQGEKFSQLAARVLSKDTAKNSIFNRGLTSAKLMVRRAVNQAGNNSRLIFLQEAKEQVPGMQKQNLATIDKRTTRLSLQMHGAIAEVDGYFTLKSGPPKPFARRMKAPPFHWNDRDSIVPYHPRYEETSSLKTADLLNDAKEALAALDS